MTTEAAKNVSFNVLLTEEMHSRVSNLAAVRNVARAHLVRVALEAYLQHVEKAQPTCADGTLCLCPNRWSRTERIKRMDGSAARTADDSTEPQ